MYGETLLYKNVPQLISPKDTSRILQRRQYTIQTLKNNPELKSEIDDLVAQAAQEQANVMELLAEKKACLDKLKAPAEMAEHMKANHEYWQSFEKSPEWRVLNRSLQYFDTGLNAVAAGLMFYICCNARSMAEQVYRTQSPAEVAMISGFNTCVFTIVAAVRTAQLRAEHLDGLHKCSLINSLYKTIIIAEKIETLCQEHGIENQYKISMITDEKHLDMIQGVKHIRYQNKSKTLPVMTSCVHAFLYEIYENEDALAPIFASIGEVDTYSTIADTMIELDKTENKLCFVTFLDQNKPAVYAKGFWNLLVKDAVNNSLCENRNIILTGPNAGGKSTSIKSMLQNIVLAQTFGIAAGESFELTQFDVVHSFLNISDDILNGLSLFASEIKRAQETLQRIKALESNEKFFFALDELFTGTAGEDGELCAYEFISNIASYDNIQFIYATHFNKLKDIGAHNASCANYKIDAPIFDKRGKLVYPYTLSAGANTVNVAQLMAKEAGLFQ